jgi:hypothetical protein
MIAVVAVCFLAAGVLAQPSAGKEVTHVVVLPVIDRTTSGGAPTAVLEKATAALALALEDSGEFTVASSSDLMREFAALGLHSPLNRQEQLRMAERLHADRVVNGYLEGISVDPAAGAGVCRIEIESLDVVAEEVIAGGSGTGQLKPLPGWKGDSDSITNQVLRDAAEGAVRDMQVKRVRRGYVESIDDQGYVHLNLGVADGLRVGDRLVVMRGIWERELEKTELRKIGTMVVHQTDSDRSVGVPVGGMPPRTGDRVYVLYEPITAQKAIERSRKVTSSARILTAVAVAAGIVAIAMGGSPSEVAGNKSAPGGQASPTESAPGVNPGILIDIFQNGQPPDPATQVKGYIIYRGTTQYLNVADPENIVQVLDQTFPGPWTDDQTDRASITFTKTWQYNNAGTQASATATILYNHRALVSGETYFYRIRRIVSPYHPQIPIAGTGTGTTQVRSQQVTFVAATQTYTPSADEVLSEPSVPLGPQTFILPAIPREPLNGSTTINPQQITFNWDLGTGPSEGNGAAARYVLVVYRADNLNNPVYQSSAQQPTSTTMSFVVNDPNQTIFQNGTDYVWAVGEYVPGETRAKNTLQLEFSQQFHFTTVNLPPSATAAGASKGGAQRTGWWGEARAPKH